VTERRIALLLAVLILGQLVLLANQAPDQRSAGGRTRVSGERSLLEGAALRAVAPVAYAVAAVFDFGGDVRRALTTRSQLRAEKQALSEENQKLLEEVTRLRGIEAEVERLAEAANYQPPDGVQLLVGDITFIDHRSRLKTLVLRLPLEPAFEVRVDAPVTSSAGLVGRVIAVVGRYARVQLLTDGASSVGAMIERTRRQGIVRGDDDGLLSLDYLPSQADVRVGDRVLTAGIDGVYPRGMVIGRVQSVNAGSEDFQNVQVAPAVDFGYLDQVYVLGLENIPQELEETLP
jgi:rod shape-determining protein MreC